MDGWMDGWMDSNKSLLFCKERPTNKTKGCTISIKYQKNEEIKTYTVGSELEETP
jgi:hypothetical protein